MEQVNACPYLKVSKLWVVEVRVNVQSGAHHQKWLELVQGGADVAGEAQAPDFQQSLQVEQNGKSNLGWYWENGNIRAQMKKRATFMSIHG